MRQGAASVTVAYRRGEENMRAAPKEIIADREEGVAFVFHKIPVAFTGADADKDGYLDFADHYGYFSIV